MLNIVRPDDCYSKTPLYGHLILLRTVWVVPQERKPLHFSKLNLFNTDAPLTRALSIAPSVTVLGAFDCTFYSRPLCYSMGSSLGKHLLFLVRPTASFFPRHWLSYMGIGFSLFVVFICTDSFE